VKWELRIKGPPAGTKRIVSKFLFLPKHIKGECRWLEYATFEQACIRGILDPILHWAWVDKRWIDEGSQSQKNPQGVQACQQGAVGSLPDERGAVAAP